VKFSVVIVNYASWPLTLRCVESLYETGYEDFEVVIVDNDRPEPPEIPYPVRLIRNEENLGFAKACNQGIAASEGDLVVLINPDSVVRRIFSCRSKLSSTRTPRSARRDPEFWNQTGASSSRPVGS